MTRPRLSDAVRSERSERMKRLNDDPVFAAKAAAKRTDPVRVAKLAVAGRKRMNRERAEKWLLRFSEKGRGHTAAQIDDILRRIQEKANAGGVIFEDQLFEEVKERVLARPPPKNGGARCKEKPTRPTIKGTNSRPARHPQ